MSADTRGIRELAEESLAEQMIAEQIVTRSTKEETLAWIRVNQPIQLTIKRMTAFAESIVEQCCNVAQEFYVDNTDERHLRNAIVLAIRSRWQRGE